MAELVHAEDLPTPLATTRRSVAERIRERLDHSGDRYFANDNIHEHIHEGELELLQDEVADKLHDVLETLVTAVLVLLALFGAVRLTVARVGAYPKAKIESSSCGR